MFDLHNQTAIVTGGAAGIGRGIVESLREAGATVIIADLDLAAAERTAAETGSHARHLDVTDREQVRTVFADIAEEFGGIQILCSNAGIFPQATSTSSPTRSGRRCSTSTPAAPSSWSRGPAVHAAGTLRTHRHHHPITGSHTGYPAGPTTWCSKAAQQGFMRGAALRSPATASPSTVSCRATSHRRLRAQGEEYCADGRGIPALRLGDPRDIGNAAASSLSARRATSRARPWSSTAARSCPSPPRRSCRRTTTNNFGTTSSRPVLRRRTCSRPVAVSNMYIRR